MARGGEKTQEIVSGRFQVSDKAEEIRHGTRDWQRVYHKAGKKILNHKAGEKILNKVQSLATVESVASVDKSCGSTPADAVRSELEKDFRF